MLLPYENAITVPVCYKVKYQGITDTSIESRRVSVKRFDIKRPLRERKRRILNVRFGSQAVAQTISLERLLSVV